MLYFPGRISFLPRGRLAYRSVNLLGKIIVRGNKVFHDRFEWSVKSRGKEFFSDGCEEDSPSLEIERPCNMRSDIKIKRTALIKNIYDNDDNVALSEICHIGRDTNEAARSVTSIAIPPKMEISPNEDKYTRYKEFITYANKVLKSQYFVNKFETVGISKEICNNTANIIINTIAVTEDVDLKNMVNTIFNRHWRNENIERDLLDLMADTIACEYPEEFKRLKSVKRLLDNMTLVNACKIADGEVVHKKRKVFLHLGPTNSGKTYHALEALKKSKSGIYCGPLRILAKEVYDNINSGGLQCSLITGEEHRESFMSRHWSTTIEMAKAFFRTEIDVGVIDEAQMVSDSFRGSSWTAAIVNLNVKELHICGEPSVCKILMKTLSSMGDEVSVKFYDRLSPLMVSDTSLKSSLNNVMPYDCIIAFSVKTLFNLKSEIEMKTPYRCAIIYGGMPPGARAEQVRLFNDPESPFKVLVATDAIGMGLNLKIRRIVFYRVSKYDGVSFLMLPPTYIKQISGRAGRFSSEFLRGEVCSFLDYDMIYIKRCMRLSYSNISKLGIIPDISIVLKLSQIFPEKRLAGLLEVYQTWVRPSNDAFLCDMNTMITYAKLTEHVKLGIRTAYKFALTPVSPNDPFLVEAFHTFISHYAAGKKCRVDNVIRIQPRMRTLKYLHTLETNYKILSAYTWLSNEFPAIFFDVVNVDYTRKEIQDSFNSVLLDMSGISNDFSYSRYKRLVSSRLKKDLELLESTGGAAPQESSTKLAHDTLSSR